MAAFFSGRDGDDDDSNHLEEFCNALMNVQQDAPLQAPMRTVSMQLHDEGSCVSEITSFSMSSLQRGSLYPTTGRLNDDGGITESITATTSTSSAELVSREPSLQINISQAIGSSTLALSSSPEATSHYSNEVDVLMPSMESKKNHRETLQSMLPPLIEEKQVLDSNRLRVMAALFPEKNDGELLVAERTTMATTCGRRVSALPQVAAQQPHEEQLVGNGVPRVGTKPSTGEEKPLTDSKRQEPPLVMGVSQPAQPKEATDNSSTNQWVSNLLSIPAASQATIGMPVIPDDLLPRGPGAFSMSAGRTTVPRDDLSDMTQNDNGVLEMANLQQPQAGHPLRHLEDSELAQAWPVSDPVVVATPRGDVQLGLSENKKSSKKVVVVILAILVSVLGSLLALPQLAPHDPNRIEHLQMKESIMDTFGKGYFDNTLKEKALHWIVYEDPRHALSVKETGHHSNLIQRFALVSLHFQTSSQQPWAYCNPPVGTQSDTCYYNANPNSRGKEVEAIAKRWLTSAHECEWMGVGCSERSVTQLSLIRNNMTGPIPAGEIVRLTYLKDLQLQGNNLSGPVPKLLFEGPHLEKLIFESNSLTGSIPPQTFSMPTLTVIRLANNQLTGSIPNEIGQLVGGIYFGFEMNLLTGSLPEGIYAATELQTLGLDQNLLTGTLSSTIGLLQAMWRLSIHRTFISGSIPSEMGNTNLGYLGMRETNVGGTIPEDLYKNRRLSALVLSNCQLSGTISEQIHFLSDLGYLSINGNANLTGSIPDKLCSQRYQRCDIVADCTPTASKGTPAIFCPMGCCSTCCDADTKICLKK